jgi:transcriptional regulator with XRE-family HTH domain
MSYTAVKKHALGALRENIVVFRARAGLSQEQLASKARVSRPVVSKMEQGSSAPSFDVLAKIADVLGCSIAELLLHEHDADLSHEDILRRAKSSTDGDIDVDDLLDALDEVHRKSPTKYSTKGRKPAMAHHRKGRRR